MTYFLRIQGIIWLYLLAINGLAQSYDISKLSTKEGLSQGMITSICEDSEGFIWVGTLSGLNRYDGQGFKTYMHDPNDPYSPAGNTVRGVLEDSKGRIWIGFEEKGIDCYDRKSDRFYHLGNDFNKDMITKGLAYPVFETVDGHIWLQGNFSVIEMVVPDEFPLDLELGRTIQYIGFERGRGLPLTMEYPILLHLPDNVPGIHYLDRRQFRFEAKTKTWKETLVRSFPIDWKTNGHEMLWDAKRKGYWLQIKRSLQFIKEGKVEQSYILPQNFEESDDIRYRKSLANATFCDYLGTIWRLEDGSLYRIYPPNQAEDSLKVETILDAKTEKHPFYKLLCDRRGSIFVGSSGYGMVHITPKKDYFDHQLKGASIEEFSFLNTDTLLISLYAHTSRFLPSKKLTLPLANLPKAEYVIQARDGRLLARETTEYNRNSSLLIVYPNGKQAEFKIPIENIERGDPLFEDRQERIWISSIAGYLACLPKDAKTMKKYDLRYLWKKEETNYIPKQIYQSKNDALWLSTTQGLVEIHVPEKGEPTFKLWKSNPENPKSLSGSSVLSVIDDPIEPNRYLWIGTNGNGLNKMDKETGNCVHYTTKNGLPNNVVYGVLSDSHHRLWLSTNLGLSCFTPKTQHFRNFTAEDGLQDNEFNTYSYCKFPDGKMGFGGINGLTLFNPDVILPDTTYAPVFFTTLKINNKEVNLRDSSGILAKPIEFTDKVFLSYKQNFISLSYVALDFSKQGNNTFYYKMEGIDQDWVYANKHTEVNYPNLNPGTYTLYVANVNEMGERNPQPAKITFIISPPLWRTWWAYLIYVLLLGFSIWRVFKFQTNRIKLQNELTYKEKEAQHLQVLDEMKTRFFTNITHEFRTPLTLIIEPARQIEETANLGFAKKQSQIILNNANRLLLLVNQLLDISKVEENQIQVNWSEGDLLIVIKDIVDWFQPVMQKKKQRLVLETQLAVLEGIVDRHILEKIIYNLLSNAHKFTTEEGHITLSITQPSLETWQMQVQDTGVGIDSEKLSHIFDRFYQVDNTLTRSNEGTGIGLALVKELCELVEGKIDVQSEVGKGTIFTLCFPLYPTTNTAILPTISQETSLPELKNEETPNLVFEANEEGADTKPQILLVEDNSELRQYLNMVLTQKGYAVLEAENGRIGIEKALAIVPDLIISDVMMPEMDGYQLTETLKNDPITSHIPIVILTAKGRQESKIEGYRRGADAYLPKPFNTDELFVRLQQLLESRRKIQEKYQRINIVSTENISYPNPAIAPAKEGMDISDLDREWLTKLEEIIREKMGLDSFAYNDLPMLMGMSRTQFFAKVKALTGFTPAILVRNIRLDTSYQLLVTQSQMTVREVMSEVGFNDAKHFTAQFKERFGITPKQST